MDSIENKLTVVDENNKKSHHIVKAMGSTWGYLKNLFSNPDSNSKYNKPIIVTNSFSEK